MELKNLPVICSPVTTKSPGPAIWKKITLVFLLATGFIRFALAGPDCQHNGTAQARNISYTINGHAVSSLAGNVRSGDVVNVCFDLTLGDDSTIFSLVSYKAPGPAFDQTTASLQIIYDADTKVFSGTCGRCCLSVKVPPCYFQVDFVTGCPIYQFGPANSNNFYSAQERLIEGDNGGAGGCNCVAQANAGADAVLSCGSASVTLNGSTYVHHPKVSWKAYLGGHIAAGANTLSATADVAGKYVMTVTDTLGCSASDTVNVTGHTGLLTAGHIGNDQSNCGAFQAASLVSMADATANPGETILYTWYQSTVNVPYTTGNANWHIIAGANAAAYSPGLVSTTTYYIRLARTTGCTPQGTAGQSNIVTVTIHPAVHVNLGPDVSITSCGGSVTLDAGNSGTGAAYTWSTGANTQTITVTASGTYTVMVSNADHCTASDTIKVNNSSSLQVHLGNDTSICAGASLMLDAGNPGAHYSWSTGASTQTINVTASGTYSVMVTSGQCSSTATIHVTVQPPVVVNLGKDTTMTSCQGSLMLDAGNAGCQYSWNTGASTETIHVSSTGTYSVMVTNSAGCHGTDVINVTINPASVHVNLGKDTVVCAGASVMLDAGNPGSQYMWSNGAVTQTITVTGSGTYSVTVTNGQCQAGGNIHVTVLPPVIVNLGHDTTITTCNGGITLDAGNAGSTYSWSTGATTETLSVSASGTYSVVVSNAAGCKGSGTIHITMNSGMIAVNLGKDTSICAGASLMLDAGNAGSQYSWSTGATTQYISVSASGTYSVTVNNGMCSGTGSVHVTVLPPVNVNLGSDTVVVFCQGHLTLNAGNSGSTYSWNTGAATQTINVTASGKYWVTVTNSAGCRASDSIRVTVKPGSLSINLGRDTAFSTCTHQTLTLDAGVSGDVYAWNTGEVTESIVVHKTGLYSVVVTNQQGCSASDTIAVTIHDNTVDVNLGHDTTVCGCILLYAGHPGASYQWCSGESYSTINACVTGVYCVSVSNGVCIGSDTIHVTVDPLPNIHIPHDTIISGGSVTLDAGPAGTTYSWSTGDLTETIVVSTGGTYYVTVTNSSGCHETDTIHVQIANGIASYNTTGGGLNIYPNPAVDKTFVLNFDSDKDQSTEIQITDQLGKVVYSEKLPGFKGACTRTVCLKDCTPGMYFANVIRNSRRSTVKVAIQ